MATSKITPNNEAIRKINLEITKASDSFEKIMKKKRDRLKAVEDVVVLTLSLEQYQVLYELIGNTSTSFLEKIGMDKRHDAVLFEIYNSIDNL